MLLSKNAQVFYTAKDTAYLRDIGVVLLSVPHVDLSGVKDFLAGFSERTDFQEYLDDDKSGALTNTERLLKFAGQLCYMSLGDARTKNVDAEKYFKNIKESGHGSVLEHASFSFLVYGCPRSLTHELVRHRAGFAFSQVSQRYVSADVLRFVERPEYQSEPELHALFEDYIDKAAEEYTKRTDILLRNQEAGSSILSGESKRDARKKVQQCSRSCLPNETEAPIVVSINVRALRHLLEMRAASPADIEIRHMAMHMFDIIKEYAPLLFNDYEKEISSDGFACLKTKYRKV